MQPKKLSSFHNIYILSYIDIYGGKWNMVLKEAFFFKIKTSKIGLTKKASQIARLLYLENLEIIFSLIFPF